MEERLTSCSSSSVESERSRSRDWKEGDELGSPSLLLSGLSSDA